MVSHQQLGAVEETLGAEVEDEVVGTNQRKGGGRVHVRKAIDSWVIKVLLSGYCDRVASYSG